MVGVRPLAAAIAGWIAGAAVSVTVGLLALSSVGADLTGSGGQPLALDTAPRVDPGDAPPTAEPSASTEPERTSSATPPVTGSAGQLGRQRRLDSAGGYVVARCRSGDAYLVYWSPATGYRAKDVERGPRQVARITFKGADVEIKMRVECADGEPRADVEQEAEDDDHR